MFTSGCARGGPARGASGASGADTGAVYTDGYTKKAWSSRVRAGLRNKKGKVSVSRVVKGPRAAAAASALGDISLLKSISALD
ncbi:hypothetical protein EVAR_44838_1 [Eumeta japonica]|uniref:Uncharacterized protein n=1 Tax=Eumeta variegata TaxID=151549 RepID=A0A4C1YIP6_EUMVA|nr:hypothetical protein EVAR_44838_1 [Eumeta japonica]